MLAWPLGWGEGVGGNRSAIRVPLDAREARDIRGSRLSAQCPKRHAAALSLWVWLQEAWVSQTSLQQRGAPMWGTCPHPPASSRVQVGSCSISTPPLQPPLLPEDRERPWEPSAGLVYTHEACSHVMRPAGD